MKSCCFTGHREIPYQEQEMISARLEEEVRRLIGMGFVTFHAGGALGFDTLAAQCVLKLKKEFPKIRLCIDVPHKGQERKWSMENIKQYQEILLFADEVNILSESYFRGCMHVRNRYMVDHSDCVIAYVRKESGGSAYTMAYAEKKGVEIIRI